MSPFKMCFGSGLVLLVLCSLIASSDAIMCYKCNSEYDPRCGDPFDPYSLGQINCSMVPELEHIPDLKATLCRKTVQKVYGTVRVVRGCGYVTDARDDRECVKRSGTHDVQALYCSCTSDLCNNGLQFVPTGFNSLLTFSTAIFMFVNVLLA